MVELLLISHEFIFVYHLQSFGIYPPYMFVTNLSHTFSLSFLDYVFWCHSKKKKYYFVVEEMKITFRDSLFLCMMFFIPLVSFMNFIDIIRMLKDET